VLNVAINACTTARVHGMVSSRAVVCLWSLGRTRTPLCTVHTELNWPVQQLYGRERDKRDIEGGVESRDDGAQ
jgi:hypothetical protein